MKKLICLFKKPARRVLALVLAVTLLCGGIPLVETQTQAQAASWMDAYLKTVVEWGVMRGDLEGNLEPDRNITRAEFVTMLNRAFGYTKTGPTPFKDVKSSDWYADDIGIAYNMGYLYGTSKTTASPNLPITREEAMVMLGKNLMYRPGVGEVLGFTDSRTFSEWSKGYIEIAAETDVVSGYPDGTFRPHNYISRGEAACIVVKALGNLVNTPGEVTLGGVYGNVLISVPGVQLKNTVIAGDLYITGGVGLGDVLLENVTVLGRIIVSGAGASNKGDSSVILRNVQANELIVDSLKDQFVTLRVEGDTTIGFTSVRTDAYIEDVTPTGYGLTYIELDGEEGTELQLAGNIKEVLNMTPGSRLVIAQGTAEKVTIDELATNSTLTINSGASIGELNLDVGTTVNGEGDIGHVNVNAPGCSIEMLPDTITIRPGITAEVDGETMDSEAANESSADPRLLAGYPTAKNVAPTSAEGVFSTNKKSTVYWALSSLADGSVSEDDLIDPPAYSGKILKNGSISMDASNTEESAKLSGLTSDGSYYISAIAVDNRGQRSPVKVTAFTTPDNTVPKFTTGYPYMSKITKDAGQVAVMSSKTCQLYYALFPKGSAAPTVSDFKSGSLSGNLGYGVRDVTKNVIDLFYVNNQTLQELASYDLYLCLIDADGGQNSGVKKLTFTTVDGTPPIFVSGPTINSIKETSVGLTASLNESGTIYWAVVKQGEEYPKPMAGQSEQPALDSTEAKLQVSSGINALKSGKVSVSSANKEVTINVSGLEKQTGYDLYYVAQDKAGNYSEWVQKITIHTLDTVAPTAEQEFSKTGDEEGKEPMPDTDISIVFSEGVQDEKSNEIFYELYQKSQDKTLTESERNAAKQKLADLLRQDIVLWDASSFPDERVPEKTGDGTSQSHWVDYNNVEVRMEDGKTIVVFKYNESIKLTSGGTYFFRLSNICDTSNNKNKMKNPTDLPEFTTVFAKVYLENEGVTTAPQENGKDVRVDMSFQMHPVSTGTVEQSIAYDVFLWSDANIRFKVYARALDDEGAVTTDPLVETMGGKTKDANGWYYLGEATLTTDNERVGTSIRRIGATSSSLTFPKLCDLEEGYTYEYAISLVQVGTVSNPEAWSDRITIGVTVPAGPNTNVGNLAAEINENTWNTAVTNGLTRNGVKPIGDPEDFEVYKQFSDTQVPGFTTSYPKFVPGDSFVNMQLQLDRDGTVYYVLAPIVKDSTGSGYDPTLVTTEENTGKAPELNKVPASGSDTVAPPVLSQPTNLAIFEQDYSSEPDIKYGKVTMSTAQRTVTVQGLKAETTYFAYFVLKGQSQKISQVYLYQFTTGQVTKPTITLDEDSPRVSLQTSTDSETSWILYANNSLFPLLKKPFYDYVKADKKTDYQNNYKTMFPEYNTDSTYAKATVLDALLNNAANGSQYSVFDVYADTAAYNEVLGRIMGTITGGVNYADRGTIKLNQNAPGYVDCTDAMTGVTQYYFLAAARNAQGSEYSFKAVGNVHLPDTKPPQLVESDDNPSTYYYPNAAQLWNANVESKYTIPKTTWQTDPSSYAFKGTITISFDEKIYQLIDENGKKELKDVTVDSLKDQLSVTGATVTAKQVGSTIMLDYLGATEGAQIVFFNNGSISDADSNSHGGGQKLILTFRTMGDGLVQVADPHWEASWSN
jgi:hypothetical protein